MKAYLFNLTQFISRSNVDNVLKNSISIALKEIQALQGKLHKRNVQIKDLKVKVVELTDNVEQYAEIIDGKNDDRDNLIEQIKDLKGKLGKIEDLAHCHFTKEFTTNEIISQIIDLVRA